MELRKKFANSGSDKAFRGFLRFGSLSPSIVSSFVLTTGPVCVGIGSDTSKQPSIVAEASHLLVLSRPMLFTIGFDSTERLTAHVISLSEWSSPTNKVCTISKYV